MATDNGAGTDGMNSGGDQKKRNKVKGTTHGLHYEILDDPNIIAESGWENVDADYWTSKLCKQYVKMYHINKLWPRDAYARQTADFNCKPHSCIDPYFVHRATEVWGAMFGPKPMSKGYINYSLASMVYAELRLKLKVDWSPFQTTKKNPLLLQQNQKDIPDSWPQMAQNGQPILQNLATPTTMASAGACAKPQLDSREPISKVMNVSAVHVNDQNKSPNRKDLVNKNGGPSSPKTDPTDEEVVGANVTIGHYVDSGVLDSLGYAAPNPQLPTPESPLNTPIIQEDLSRMNVQQPNAAKMNVTVDTDEFIKKYPHLSSLDSTSFKNLVAMPQIPHLEGLLDLSMKWKTVEERLFPFEQRTEQNQPESSTPPRKVYRPADFPNAALALTLTATWIDELAPRVGAFADELASLAPTLLSGATAFLHFTDQMLPILTSAIHCEESHVELRQELKDSAREIIQLSTELNIEREKEKREERIQRMAESLKCIEPSQGTQGSDQLSLPMDKGKAHVELVQKPLPIGRKSWLDLQKELDQSNAEKALLQSKLDQMIRVQAMDEYLPRSGSESRWLGWVQNFKTNPY